MSSDLNNSSNQCCHICRTIISEMDKLESHEKRKFDKSALREVGTGEAYFFYFSGNFFFIQISEAFHVNCPSARRVNPKSCYF